MNMNTPYTKYYDESAPYRFNTDLELAVNAVLEEALAYKEGRKYGVKQQELPFGTPGDTDTDKKELEEF